MAEWLQSKHVYSSQVEKFLSETKNMQELLNAASLPFQQQADQFKVVLEMFNSPMIEAVQKAAKQYSLPAQPIVFEMVKPESMELIANEARTAVGNIREAVERAVENKVDEKLNSALKPLNDFFPTLLDWMDRTNIRLARIEMMLGISSGPENSENLPDD